MEWVQVYDPLGQAWLSTLVASLPIVLLLGTLAFLEWPAHKAAGAGLVAALLVAVGVYGMPVPAALGAAVGGAAFGLFPIGWIVLNGVFLYNLTVHAGEFDVVKRSVAQLSADRRIQALLIAFSFGAFIEGGAGFGTPVAICAALLLGLGFPPLYAASLALIANTAPVAYGSIGTPILTLAAVTGLPAFELGAMAGRQLPFVSIIIPAWMVAAMTGLRGMWGVLPAALVAGASFGLVQFLWSNTIGPELVDIAAGVTSLVCLALFCKVWQPRDTWDFPAAWQTSAALGTFAASASAAASAAPPTRAQAIRAWMPWVFLSLFVVIWGATPTKALLNGGPAGLQSYLATGKPPVPNPWLSPSFDIPGLHRNVFRDYPVEPEAADRARLSDPDYKNVRGEAARFTLNWLSATGTGILFSALLSAFYLGLGVRDVWTVARITLRKLRFPLTTIGLMLALGYVTRYGGTDATLGLAFTKTGWFYPFFAAMLGWLGVALTGSDTSSNVLFGSLQKITAQQLGLSPILTAAANSTGGVMGKMIDAQSIVVATAATGQHGTEGTILRFVFWHSVALASIMGLIVMLQAYLFPWMIP
jgi:lactate permease